MDMYVGIHVQRQPDGSVLVSGTLLAEQDRSNAVGRTITKFGNANLEMVDVLLVDHNYLLSLIRKLNLTDEEIDSLRVQE